MASIYDLKPAFQDLLRPAVRALARAGITANQVTVLALVLSCGLGSTLSLFPSSRGLLLLIPGWMIVRMALNAIDGLLAREHNMQTPLGGLLNEITDVLADAALILPFALVPGLPSGVVVLIVVLAGATELTGVVATRIGASRRYDGPMGKSDRAAAFGILALLLGLGVQPGGWSHIFLWVVLVGAALTVINRGRLALMEIGT